MHVKTQQQGFTLLQMILYIAMMSIIVFATAQILITLLQSREKARVIAEVESEASFVLEQIATSARNAETITLPVAGASASSVTLDVVDVADDPTVIALTAGAVTITEGAGSTTALTSDQVTVSAFTIENVSVDGTPGSLHVTMTVSYASSTDRNEYDYTQTYTTSISLR